MNHAIKVMAMAILLLGVNLLFAQQDPPPHMRGHEPPPFRLIDRIGSIVELTDTQQEDLNTIKDDFKAQFEDLKNQEFENREGHREAMKGLLESLKEEINNVLTPEQQSQLENHRSERQNQMKELFESIDHKALREEIKAYNDANVKPVLIEQRLKLDELISEEDQVLLASLRTKMAPEKKERLDKFNGPKSKKNKPELTEEQMENRAQLKGLMEQYKEDIKSLMEEIKEDRAIWDTDIKAIRSKYIPEEMIKEEGERPQRGAGKGKNRMKRVHFHHMAGFLLMDPNAKEELEVDFMNEPEKEIGAMSLKLYPNPSNSFNRLEYDLQISGNTRIELRRENGSVERVLMDNYQDAGQQMLDVEVSNLESGIYYITIIDSNGMTYTEKMIVNK